jgi:hypothetical protein
MKGKFLIAARQSGKTTKAIQEYNKDSENTLFITHSMESAKYLKDKYGVNNICSCNNLMSYSVGKKFKKFIIDEYLFFKNKDKVYNYLKNNNFSGVHIFSSADKRYDKKSLDKIREGYQYGELKNEITKEIYDELSNSFLCDKNIELVIERPKYVNSDLLFTLGEKKYRLEILNDFLYNLK